MVGNSFISYNDEEVTWTVQVTAKQIPSTTFFKYKKKQVSWEEGC